MMILKVATRNVLRNIRRSSMTVSAIGVGAMCLLLFGEFIFRVILAMQTVAVSQSGHVSVFKNGYFKYGAGNPTAYGIDHYPEVMRTIAEDPVIQPLLKIITPTVTLFGIAGNFDIEASKTFYGIGVVPTDYNQMRRWDEYHLGLGEKHKDAEINESDITHGILGVGIARILGLCGSLHLTDCPPQKDILPSGSSVKRDFSHLSESSPVETIPAQKESTPRLDLLAGTAAGAPNVVSLYIDRAVQQGVKELDDAFVGMNLELAQQLLYGRGEKKAVAIVLQLHRTEDMKTVRTRLEKIFKEKNLDLEVRDLLELQPFYKQALGMFSAIFGFIAVIMLVIVLFTVINTMSMSVMERTNEIGTLRALGVKKRGITNQFVLEGALLGFTGATGGIILGSIVAEIVNHSGMTWLPPGQAARIPLRVMDQGVGSLLLGIWIGLGIMATLAAWIPARQAARMKIVDALGHI